VVHEANKVHPVFEVKTAAPACQVFSAKTVLQVKIYQAQWVLQVFQAPNG
jgi:hypothetical protein